MKDDNFSQMNYPSNIQMPSAPPTYDEAVYQPQAQGVLYPPPHTGNPYPPQGNTYPTPGMFAPPLPPSPQVHANYPQQPQQQPRIEITHQTIVNMQLGSEPARITCPHCRTEVLTHTETEASCMAHICCLVCFLFICWPCSCLPYCVDSLKNVRHTCPNCKSFLGVYQP